MEKMTFILSKALNRENVKKCKLKSICKKILLRECFQGKFFYLFSKKFRYPAIFLPKTEQQPKQIFCLIRNRIFDSAVCIFFLYNFKNVYRFQNSRQELPKKIYPFESDINWMNYISVFFWISITINQNFNRRKCKTCRIISAKPYKRVKTLSLQMPPKILESVAYYKLQVMQRV